MRYYEIASDQFTLKVDTEQSVFSVILKSGDIWEITKKPYILFTSGKTAEFPLPTESMRTRTGTYEGVRSFYEMPESDISIMTHVYVDFTSNDLVFELRVDGDKKDEIEVVSFPAPFNYGAKKGEGYTVIPRMQGALIPAGTQTGAQWGTIFGREAYMPMYGQVRKGSGYTAIIDTPYDARYAVDEDRILPLFRPSMGTMSYIRKMIFRFREPCDYNVIAKCYRAYVKERGKLITLKEKISRNPNVERLLGCPVIHTEIAVHRHPLSDGYFKDNPEKNDYYVTFAQREQEIRELKAKGLDKAYTHFDGWGSRGYDNFHPSPFPPHKRAGGAEGMKKLSETVREVGYIFGVHDQYRDFYLDGPDFSYEEATMKIDGAFPYKTYWCGGPHTYLCSTRAIDYVRRNYAEFEKLGIKVESAYLDVFSLADMDECYNPDHPTTREQCAINRIRCFDILTDKGIIPSSEEIIDCVLPAQVLCHHANYSTSKILDLDESANGIPIPLLNLVYHDCVIIPWIGLKGEFNGPEVPKNDTAYSHAILNGNPVYCPINATEEQIKEVKFACELSEKLALCEMVKHEFLSDDYRIQKTTYSDGTTVTVNFDTEEYKIKKL